MMLCVMASTLGFSNVGETKKIPLPVKITVKIVGEIGKYEFDCKKISFQCLDIELGVEIVNERTVAPIGSIIASIVMEKQGELLFTYNLPNEPFEPYFNVSKNTMLSKSICRAFGYTSMEVPSGEYPNRKNNDGSMTATLKVRTK